MQSLEQEIDRSEQSLTPGGQPALRGLLADQATAHAEEVRLLRQRVATLEAALASAKASPIVERSVEQRAPHFTSDTPPCRTEFVTSEFSEPVSPAVVSMSRHDLAKAMSTQAEASDTAMADTAAVDTDVTEAAEAEVVPDQGFADAWSDTVESSFEERVAQKAFFQVGSVDEESRTWLLTS